MVKTGLILAGGKGTRMGKLTKDVPKCLLKIGKFAILSHLYTQLRISKLEKIVICTGYKSKKIKNFCKINIHKESDLILRKLNISNKIKKPKIFFSELNKEASTSQRLIKAKKFLYNDNIFLFLYGDTLLKYDIKSLYKKFISKKLQGILTISNPPSSFGVINIKNNHICSFDEKKSLKNIWGNSGWGIFKTKDIKKIKNIDINFENYFFSSLILKKSLGFLKNKGFYLPIDRLEDLKKGSNVFKKNINAWF